MTRLQAIAAKVDTDLGVEEIGPGCREVGRVENPQPFLDHDGTGRPDAVGETITFP